MHALAPGLYLNNETVRPGDNPAGTCWGQERPIRSESGQNKDDRAKVARGPSRVHRGALTSNFGPARLLGDGWVCDMALGRLRCARIGDGDGLDPLSSEQPKSPPAVSGDPTSQ